MIDETTWAEIVMELSGTDAALCARAAARLQAEVSVEDSPGLLQLLDSDNICIREAAAWSLAELVGPAALQELFSAYQRGFDAGQDNDGFTAALLEIPSLHPMETKVALEKLSSYPDDAIRRHASWLREFC